MRGGCVMYRERMYLTRSRYIRGEEGDEEDEGGKKLRLNSRGSRRGNTGGATVSHCPLSDPAIHKGNCGEIHLTARTVVVGQ